MGVRNVISVCRVDRIVTSSYFKVVGEVGGGDLPMKSSTLVVVVMVVGLKEFWDLDGCEEASGELGAGSDETGGERGEGGLRQFILKWQLTAAEKRTDLKFDTEYMVGW